MKQSAAKTLGVAALGAAFAAAGAGAANAAPALPDASALGGLTSTLPAESLPGAGHALSQGQGAAGAGLAAAQPAVGKVLADGPTKPITGLLGGLPVQGLGSSGLNGIPLG